MMKLLMRLHCEASNEKDVAAFLVSLSEEGSYQGAAYQYGQR